MTYGSEIHPNTHTHEMSYMRCFKDIATAGTGLVDAEVVQPIDEFCTGSIPWSKKPCPSQCSCKHPSTGDGNSFSFTIWKIWRILEEKVEKIWRKLVEHFSFAILLRTCFK